MCYCCCVRLLFCLFPLSLPHLGCPLLKSIIPKILLYSYCFSAQEFKRTRFDPLFKSKLSLWHWKPFNSVQFSSFQLLSHVQLFVTPWTGACQTSLSITNSRSLLRLMSIESVMPSNHLILCCPLLLLPSIFPSFRVFSNELVLCIRWPKYWSFSLRISLSNEYSELISFRID